MSLWRERHGNGDRQRGLQLGCNSCFVAMRAGGNYLISLRGDVAERLKAAVC